MLLTSMLFGFNRAALLQRCQNGAFSGTDAATTTGLVELLQCLLKLAEFRQLPGNFRKLLLYLVFHITALPLVFVIFNLQQFVNLLQTETDTFRAQNKGAVLNVLRTIACALR